MKYLLMFLMLVTFNAFADIDITTKDEQARLDAQVASVMKITQERLASMTDEEKHKLVDDLNHPDGKTVGQGAIGFGQELGKGLGDAAKELGLAANEFANSRVGVIASVVVIWHFLARPILWFILIMVMLKSYTGIVQKFCSVYGADGKFQMYSTKNLSSDTAGCLFFGGLFILGFCGLGAGINF